MRDPFHKSKTPELFSAWLDGNLPFREMLAFSNDVNKDPELKHIAKLCDIIDDDITAFNASGDELPEELCDDNFDIPDPNSYYPPSRLVGDACCYCAPPPEEESMMDKIRNKFGWNDHDEQ